MLDNVVLPFEEALEIIGDPKTAFPEVANRGEPSLHSMEDQIPRFNLMELKNVRNLIRAEWRDEWHRRECDPAFIEDILMPCVRKAVPPRVSDINLLTTLKNHVLSKNMNKPLWLGTAVRIAGNLAWVRYKPLTIPVALPHHQWAVLETMEAISMRSKIGKPMAVFEYRIRTGNWADCVIKKYLSINFLPMYGDCLGMGKQRWKKQPRLYVGTNLFAFLDPASKAESLTFSKIYGSTPCKAINAYYAKGRTEECIHGFNHTCWHCPRGLTGEQAWQCKVGTHQRPWVQRRCNKCNKERWFYAEWPRNHTCINCTEGRGR